MIPCLAKAARRGAPRERWVALENSVPSAGYLFPVGNGPGCNYNWDVRIQDVYRLYPPRRRGTGGHRESHSHWRTPPENHYCYSSRQETPARAHYLPDRLRLRQRTAGG